MEPNSNSDFTEDVTLNNVGFTNTNYELKPVDATLSQQGEQNGDTTTNLKRSSDKHKKSEILNKVFIGGLKYTTDEETFKNYFQKYGTLTDYVIIKDPTTKRSRGFGFVKYSDTFMVDELMRNRPHFIDERKLDIKRITPKNDSNKSLNETNINKLFIARVDESIDENDLKEYFINFGRIVDIKIIKNPAQSKRFAFVTFDDYDPVDKIVASKVHVIKDNKLICEKAKPKEFMVGRDDKKNRQQLTPNQNRFNSNVKNTQMCYSNYQANQNQQTTMTNANFSSNTNQINTNLNQIYASYNQAKSNFSNQNASYLMNQIYSNQNASVPGPLRNKKNFFHRQNTPYNKN